MQNDVEARPDNFPKYESSCSSYSIQDEKEESLTIHQLHERPYFNFQVDTEERRSFQKVRNAQMEQKDPIETVQEHLYTEERVEFANSALKQIPTFKQSFINIRLLNLQQNQLTNVPAQIMYIQYFMKFKRKMVNLCRLNLNKNSIKTLPPFLQSLKHLEYLDVAENMLTMFSINPPSLKYLNIAQNLIEQLYFPNVEHLCIQMNPFTQIPKGFQKILYGMQQLELDWFKYCKPALQMKLNFEKHYGVKEKLVQALSSDNLSFFQFVNLLSLQQPSLTGSDYKDRNLYHIAGLGDEIGIINSLYKIIPDLINQADYDQYSPLSSCYQENKLRSVKVLNQLGGKFSRQSIMQICQRGDLECLNMIIQQYSNQFHNESREIELRSLVNFRNADGNTPMHMVFLNFGKNPQIYEKIVDVLIKYGCDANQENIEYWSPLDFAVRKGYLQALQFAYKYNQKYNDRIIFNFGKNSGPWDWNLVHLAASSGNLDVLEWLLKVNVDFFTISKCQRCPKQLAIQSLTMLKSMRKFEKIWINKNIINENGNSEQIDKNVYQMKYQIEKNMAKKHQNMIQKVIDQSEEYDQYEFEESDCKQDKNEVASSVASERSIKESILDSAPIFQRMANKLYNNMQIQKQNIEHLNQQDFSDHNPEILRLLRNQQLDQAINKIKNILLSDLLPLSERIKYKIQLHLLDFKLKHFKIYDLKSYLSKGIEVTLNEYQFKPLTVEQRNHFHKLILIATKELLTLEKGKIKSLVDRLQAVCKKPQLNTDLYVQDVSQIQDLRNRLSNNLVFDINNYTENIQSLQEQLAYWETSILLNPTKFNIRTQHVHTNFYERAQKFIQVQNPIISQRQLIENSDYIIEAEQSIGKYREFAQLNTPFQKQLQ